MLCLMKDNVKEDEKDYKPKGAAAKVSHGTSSPYPDT